MIELLFFFSLLLKHTFVDIFLQTFIENSRKQYYFNKQAHLHYFQHGIGTFVISLLFSIEIEIAILFFIFDYLTHWHIDFSKTNLVKNLNWHHNDRKFWRLQTLDQGLHYLVYYMMSLVHYYIMEINNFIIKLY